MSRPGLAGRLMELYNSFPVPTLCDCRVEEKMRICDLEIGMSDATYRHIPPTSETIQTKPFPIRGMNLLFHFNSVQTFSLFTLKTYPCASRIKRLYVYLIYLFYSICVFLATGRTVESIKNVEGRLIGTYEFAV